MTDEKDTQKERHQEKGCIVKVKIRNRSDALVEEFSLREDIEGKNHEHRLKSGERTSIIIKHVHAHGKEHNYKCKEGKRCYLWYSLEGDHSSSTNYVETPYLEGKEKLTLYVQRQKKADPGPNDDLQYAVGWAYKPRKMLEVVAKRE